MTTQKMMEILSRYLNHSLVWIGAFKAEDDSVSILSLAGPRREVAVKTKIYIGTGGFDGSVRNALENIVAQYMPLLGDNSYSGWPISDDVIFHASLSVPYRSLSGDKGIIVFFCQRNLIWYHQIILCGCTLQMISPCFWKGTKKHWI